MGNNPSTTAADHDHRKRGDVVEKNGGRDANEPNGDEENPSKRRRANILELDVGGQLFKTSRETILQYNSPYFARLLKEDDEDNSRSFGLQGAQVDETGRLFIDGSPDLFKLVLEYMRGSLDFNSLTTRERNSLKTEAIYYGLDTLLEELSCERGKGYDARVLSLEDQEIRSQGQQIREDLRNSKAGAPADADAVLIDLFQGGTRKFSGQYDVPLTGSLSEMPILFEEQVNLARRDPAVYMSPAASVDEFKRRLETYAGPLFQNFPLENLVVAGGAVLHALIGDSEQSSEFDPGDVDLFVVATDDAKARATYDRILSHLSRRRPDSIGHNELLVVRSAFAVTFSVGYPQRNIQVILRRHSCTADVVFGFDVDCCQVAWDGSRVLATPSAYRALSTGINIADPERSSLRYERRLAKYAGRGFRVAVPGLDVKRVKPKFAGSNVFTIDEEGNLKHVALEFQSGQDRPSVKIDSQGVTGLAKLLVYSKLGGASTEYSTSDSTGFPGDVEGSTENFLVDVMKMTAYTGYWKCPTPPHKPPNSLCKSIYCDDFYSDSDGGGPLLPFSRSLDRPHEIHERFERRLSFPLWDYLAHRAGKKMLCCYQFEGNVRPSVEFPVILDASRQYPNASFDTGRGSLKRRLEFPSSSISGTNPWLRGSESDWTNGVYSSPNED